MTKTQHRVTFSTAALLTIAGLLMLRAPHAITGPLKTNVADAAYFGQRLVSDGVQVWQAWRFRFDASARQLRTVKALRAELAAAQLELRQARLDAATLRQEKEALQQGMLPAYAGETGLPLVVPGLLNARVIGEQTAEWWRSGRWIDHGRQQGVEESALVLEGTEPLIDQGADAGVEQGQSVYAGRYVVGRVVQAGRWSSLVQPVSDPAYSGVARLMHRSSRGLLDGPEGIIEGHRDGRCRLKFIRSTVSVRVGDEVVTGGRDGAFPDPMVYGTVVKAELPEGSPHWEILVQPEADVRRVTEVQVFRRTVNPHRLLAN